MNIPKVGGYVVLEKDMVKKIKKALETKFPGSFWFKTHGGPFQMAGIPDLIGCCQGKFIGIEVKQPGKEKTLTKIQGHVISLINKAGGCAFMSTDASHAVEMVKNMVK